MIFTAVNYNLISICTIAVHDLIRQFNIHQFTIFIIVTPEYWHCVSWCVYLVRIWFFWKYDVVCRNVVCMLQSQCPVCNDMVCIHFCRGVKHWHIWFQLNRHWEFHHWVILISKWITAPFLLWELFSETTTHRYSQTFIYYVISQVLVHILIKRLLNLHKTYQRVCLYLYTCTYIHREWVQIRYECTPFTINHLIILTHVISVCHAACIKVHWIKFQSTLRICVEITVYIL